MTHDPDEHPTAPGCSPTNEAPDDGAPKGAAPGGGAPKDDAPEDDVPDEVSYVPPPLPPWTDSRDVANLHDALAHVMADALSLTALASFARWNVAEVASARFADVFAERVRAGRRAQEVVARRMRALGGPVMLHPTDPSEVPRWMLAGQSADPVAELVLLAAGTHEFVRSVEAAAEVSREVPDPECMRVMRRLQRREEAAVERLRALANATVEAKIRRGATRH